MPNDNTQDPVLRSRTRQRARTARACGVTATDWTREGEWLTMTHTLAGVRHSSYLRIRGTNTNNLEPEPDAPGEDPWTDLWFYSNPIFIEIN